MGCELAHKAKLSTIVDIEKSMVNRALANIKVNCVANKINAFVDELCNIKLDTKFDIIIVPRESIQLLTPDNVAIAIANLGDHLLRHTGILIIDVATFRVILTQIFSVK